MSARTQSRIDKLQEKFDKLYNELYTSNARKPIEKMNMIQFYMELISLEFKHWKLNRIANTLIRLHEKK